MLPALEDITDVILENRKQQLSNCMYLREANIGSLLFADYLALIKVSSWL